MTYILHPYINRYFSHYSGLSKLCWYGIILSFIEATLIGGYSFLSLYFINDLKFSISQAGLIISFYGLGAIAGGYISGKLSDKFSPAKVAIFCLLLQSGVFLGLIQLRTFNLLAIDLMMMGIASYGFLTALHLWVLNECQSNETIKLRALNILSASSNLGGAISAILIGVMISCGFHLIFYAAGMLLLFSAIAFALMIKNADAQKNQINEITKSKDLMTSKKRNQTIIWVVLSCLFMVGLIIFQSNTTLSVYVQNKYPHLGVKGVSILFSINCLMVVLLQTPLINAFSKYNKLVLVGVGGFLLGFGMLMLTFAANFTLAIIAYITHTIGEMLFFSVAQFLCYENAATNKKGYVIGLYRMIYASSRVVAPAAGGYIYQQWGGNMLWYLCGMLGLLCFELCNYRSDGWN